MSMVINLVEDHNIYLCEGGPVYNGGVQPTPITYLTQWKIVGNSEVHTLPYPDGVVLPNGYKRCEYLQSDGTAYIEVPFGFNKTDEVYAKVATLDITHSDKFVIAPKTWNNNDNRFGIGGALRRSSQGNNFYFCAAYGSASTNTTYLSPDIQANTDVHIWQYKNYGFLYDDNIASVDVSSITFGSETDNLRLFYGHNSPTECKICEYRHKKANAEYRLIPCLDSNDTPCMYDVINNQAYYNSASSGSFTYKLYPQPTEIWSCGEYNATDGKYHILVQPQGGSIADIALTAPLRKVNDVVDTIEFPSNSDGKALVTRKIASVLIKDCSFIKNETKTTGKYRYKITNMSFILASTTNPNDKANVLCNAYSTISANDTYRCYEGVSVSGSSVLFFDSDYNTDTDIDAFKAANVNTELIGELATPTTELVDAPQIAEADSYTCVISQGGKAVEWSSFITNSE